MTDLLGIECGATQTVALFEQADEVQRAVFGPANLRLLSDRQLAAHLRKIAKAIDLPEAVTIGMAGARTTADKKRLQKAAVKVWPKASHIHATNDLETALAADTQRKPLDRVLVLSGTGSCCFGQAPDGTTAKLGGWGHILGDKGSGYEIGLRALKACVFYLDRDGTWSALGQRILRRLQLNSPDQLIDWVAGAAKPEIADLAREVFAAHARRDKIAADILDGAASTLAKDACACARKLAGKTKPVRFLLAGSVLLRAERGGKERGAGKTEGRRAEAHRPPSSVSSPTCVGIVPLIWLSSTNLPGATAARGEGGVSDGRAQGPRAAARPGPARPSRRRAEAHRVFPV